MPDFRYRGFLYALGGEIPKRSGFCRSVVKVRYMLIGAAIASPVAVGYTHERPPLEGRLGLHQRRPVAVGLAGYRIRSIM